MNLADRAVGKSLYVGNLLTHLIRFGSFIAQQRHSAGTDPLLSVVPGSRLAGLSDARFRYSFYGVRRLSTKTHKLRMIPDSIWEEGI